MKQKIHKPGSWHWKKGYRNFHDLLKIANDGDKILFPSRIFEIKEQAAIHNDLVLEGSKSTVLLIPNNPAQERSFNQQGLYLSGKVNVTMQHIVFDLEPETYGIDVASNFTGVLTLDQIKTRHKRRILYTDKRPFYPSIRIKGSGSIRINRSTLDYVAIDAPDMIIYIEQSTIGSFEHNSLIRGKEVHIIDSTIHNCQLAADNGVVSDLKTSGGIALQGAFDLARTHLLPLEPARPELYPQALTYILTLPGSVVHIKDILSNRETKPPFYRHFDFRQSKVTLNGTEGLTDQLLDNVLTKSTVHVKGGNWIKDPTPQQQYDEQLKLTKAYQEYA